MVSLSGFSIRVMLALCNEFEVFFLLNSIYYFWLCLGFVATRGLSLVAVHGLHTVVASLVAEHRLKAPGLQQLMYAGLAAPRCVKSSHTRDQTSVSYIARWILNHWTTREILKYPFLYKILE